MIKDLWALRLQLLKGRLSDPEKDGEQLFTSKPEMKKSEVGKIKTGANIDIEAEDEEEKINRERESIKDRGSDMPTLIESLGICYLAMILLRLPISVGDLQRYLNIHLGEGLEGGVGEEAPRLANTNYSSMTTDGRSKSESHSSGQPDLFQE